MASYEGNLRSVQAPFNNLEIKGRWNGSESSPVELQVSIEVFIRATVVVSFYPHQSSNPWHDAFCRSNVYRIQNYSF